jgi:hypothetical protein
VRRLLATEPRHSRQDSEASLPSRIAMAGPAAQDRMRAVKARLLECLPSCRTFLDVDGNICWEETRDRKDWKHARMVA